MAGYSSQTVFEWTLTHTENRMGYTLAVNKGWQNFLGVGKMGKKGELLLGF